jgi:nucleoside-diphosphate-sugar epimerase
MNKILITGGAGYIGSVLVPRLLEKGHHVTVLDNYYFNQSSLSECCKYDSFDLIRGDCRDSELLKKLISDHEVLIPLAALVGAPICKLDPINAKSINQDAIELMCSLASKDHKILMPVSNSGYGIGESGKFCTEESPLNPISIYGSTKVNAENIIMDRVNSISFRLATVFGLSSRMRTDLLVNDFTYRAINDKTVVIFEGHFRRNFIHIQDIANVFMHGLDNFESMKGNVYNVGLDEANLTKLELCEEIKKLIPDFVFIEAAIGEDPDKRDYLVSNKKILSTGFRTKWNLDRGIRELIKGYRIFNNNKFGNV